MRRLTSKILLLLGAFLVACSPPETTSAAILIKPANSYAVAALAAASPYPDPTTTATPFQPVPPTPTATLTPTPTPKPTPTQLRGQPQTEINPSYQGGEPPDDQVRILILGSDARGDGAQRTDVIILAVINPDGTASMISFPRDLWVFIPGYGENRINTAFQMGGFDALASALEYNFGARPDFYVLTNFQGFVNIVDSLGGVTITATQELVDTCVFPYKHGICRVEVGTTTLNGYEALWYVRSRKTTGDFDRTRRAQEVLQGLFFQLMSRNAIAKADKIYEALRDNVDTNLRLRDILPLIPIAPKLLRAENVRRYAIGPGYVWDTVIPGSGAMVLMPNLSACRQLVQQALAP